MLISLLISPKLAWAEISWETAIQAVEEKGSKYFDYAMKLGSGYPGTALHGLEHNRHICAIIGRMLGFREEIRWAETLEDPPLVPHADPQDLMAHSMSLDAWVAAAHRALSMTAMQRKNLWNLECIGNHHIPKTTRINDTELHSDFSVSDDTLIVYGDIESGFYARFLQALNDNPKVASVALGSAGGNVAEAILAGIEIRKRRLATTLHGPCFSACPLIFMGGTERQIWPSTLPALGFHRLYSISGEVVPLKNDMYKYIVKYLLAMNIDPLTVIQWMSKAGPNEIFEPDLEDLCKPRIATWVQRICGF